MHLKEWKSQGNYAHIQSMDIFYQLGGKGPTLLLLPAYPTSSWGWHKLWEKFTTDFQVIAIDTPGLGFSAKPKNYSYSIISITDVITELLTQLQLSSIHLLAHAYGCSMAQELLTRQDAVSLASVTYLNGSIFPSVAHTTRMQRFLLTPPGALLSRILPTPYSAFKNNFSKTFHPNTLLKEQELREYWELLIYNQGNKRVPQVIRYLTDRQVQHKRWLNEMIQTDIPQGLILFKQDPFIDHRTAKLWQRHLPHSPLVISDEPTGHYPPLEVPKAVWGAYEKLYKKHLSS